MSSHPGIWLLALWVLGTVSCSGGDNKLNPVKGKVLLNKQPLAGALVTLHPKGETGLDAMPSTGLTGEDGTFTITTGDKEGAPAGEYVVTIICSVVPPTKGKKSVSTAQVETQDRLKGAYANRDASKITVTIKEGENELEPFDLK